MQIPTGEPLSAVTSNSMDSAKEMSSVFSNNSANLRDIDRLRTQFVFTSRLKVVLLPTQNHPRRKWSLKRAANWQLLQFVLMDAIPWAEQMTLDSSCKMGRSNRQNGTESGRGSFTVTRGGLQTLGSATAGDSGSSFSKRPDISLIGMLDRHSSAKCSRVTSVLD